MPRAPKRNYVLAVLLIILAFNFVDFLVIGIVLQNIKVDLSLTDTELGLLTGITFALFYSLMGIPIARWADRGNRVTIVTLTTAVWSAAVALCGFAGSFAQLVVCRFGVAVGEAGCQPPALSLLSDYFNRAELPRAVARYHLGWPLALFIGYFSAGWLNQFYGWRTTFVVMGLPGLALAALAGLTLREPRRSQIGPLRESSTQSSPGAPNLTGVLLALWRNKAYRHLLLALSVSSFFVAGQMQWQPAFFERTHSLSSGELGTWLSVIYGAGAGLGVLAGGEMASRLAANNERLQLRAIGVLYVLYGILTAAAYLAADYRVAFSLYAIAVFGGAAGNGPMFAASQTLVAPRMRAVSTACINLSSNLIGLGFGSLAVGAVSDALRPLVGQESLRYALVGMCPGYLWVTWHLWRAGGSVACALQGMSSGFEGNASEHARSE